MRFLLITVAIMALSIFACADPRAGEEYSGGDTTVFQEGQNAFSMPLSNLSRESRRAHIVGNSFFSKNWVVANASTGDRDGLGPLFHARSCSGCHIRDGRGAPPEEGELMTGLLFRLSIPGKGENGLPIGDPHYGTQLGVRSVPGLEPEGDVEISYELLKGAFTDGTTYTLQRPVYRLQPIPGGSPPHQDLMMSPRIAPPLHGLGLLEVITEETILSNTDPLDSNNDGISGRANWVWNAETEQLELGRFGWKSNEPDLRQQTASAFLADIGITSSIRPLDDLTESQFATLKEEVILDSEAELDDKILDRVVLYLQTLAPPARRDWTDPEVLRGKELFHKANCVACHIPELSTGNSECLPELAKQTIRPYTDLLLHDMGADLADNRPDFEATGTEWRTPPLWGIGLTEAVNGHTRFLHDGRARNLEEAILWHGGEAEESQQFYLDLPEQDRAALLSFLQSL